MSRAPERKGPKDSLNGITALAPPLVSPPARRLVPVSSGAGDNPSPSAAWFTFIGPSEARFPDPVMESFSAKMLEDGFPASLWTKEMADGSYRYWVSPEAAATLGGRAFLQLWSAAPCGRPVTDPEPEACDTIGLALLVGDQGHWELYGLRRLPGDQARVGRDGPTRFWPPR